MGRKSRREAEAAGGEEQLWGFSAGGNIGGIGGGFGFGGMQQEDMNQMDLSSMTPEQSLFLGGLLSGVLGSVGPIMSGVSSVVSASMSGGGGCGHGCQKARRRRARRKRREENGGAPQFD